MEANRILTKDERGKKKGKWEKLTKNKKTQIAIEISDKAFASFTSAQLQLCTA